MVFKDLNPSWSLDELYTGFDDPRFDANMRAFEKKVEEFGKEAAEIIASDKAEAEKAECFIKQVLELESFCDVAAYANLVLAVDTENEVAQKAMDKFRTINNEIAAPYTVYKKFIAQIEDLQSVIDSSPLLKEHEYFLTRIKEMDKYSLSETEEAIACKYAQNGSDAWETLQSLLTSTLAVDIKIKGKKTQKPLSVVRNMAYEASAKRRKKAYKAEIKAYTKIEKSVAMALNSIKGEAIVEAKLRGYKSPLEMTLLNSRMDGEILDALISAMEDFLPSLRKYYNKKAQILGVGDKLPFYDLFAPVGKSDMTFTYEEAAGYIVRNFSKFSKRLGDFAANAFNNRWIDAFPKEGKVGGAFCASLGTKKQSRILSNFVGSYNDVRTLAHELGHAYHNLNVCDESLLNSDYPMPIAETASTFCETIITAAALETAKGNEKLALLNNMISDELQVIVDIYSRFVFESNLFEKRVDGPLSVDELKNLMLDAQKKAYGDGLDEKYLHPYMWLCKGHYYSVNYNFYNYPYAYGLLFSKGLYTQFVVEGAGFPKKYDALLNATGKNNLDEVGRKAGIDVRDKAFWVQSLKQVQKAVDEFCKL